MTDTPTPEEHEAEGYRQVGRYVTEFSRLVWVMRDLLLTRLRRPEDAMDLIQLPLQRMSPRHLSGSFFDMCRTLAEHDQDEAKAAKALYGVIGDHIELRNAVAHGDLLVGYFSATGGDSEGPKPVPTEVWRGYPGTARFQSDKPDFDKESEELEALRGLVRQYGALCFGHPPRPGVSRVRDILVIEDGRPTFGPLASRYIWRV